MLGLLRGIAIEIQVDHNWKTVHSRRHAKFFRQGIHPLLKAFSHSIHMGMGVGPLQLVDGCQACRSFWYRYYLDLLLILPTWYAYRQLTLRGSLAGLIVDRPEDLYRDPMLILVPAIFVLTASLLTMRLFPLVMRAIDVLANLTPWLSIHLALRQLGRQGQDYVKPLLLVIVSLAMGVYMLSMAASLDQWLVDRMYYSVGTDITFTPQPFTEGIEYTSGAWIPEPSAFRKVEGVAGAARVGHMGAHINLTADEEIAGQFMAIDRLDFQSVAWFRPDFASEPLGELMNRLALAQDNILVPHDFMVEHNLWIGAQIPILITSDTFSSIRSNFTIVGTYDYFSTVYEDRLVVIGNMDYVDMLLGTTMPHDIWLKLEPGVDSESVWESIPGATRVITSVERDTQAMIAQEQSRMERVGIFGTLSAGFVAATAMAILGLLLYSYASLQERVYRFAVLHAVGLSRGQIVAQVIMEYTFLAIFGALAGALIGVFASELFVPFFRFTGIQNAPLPPLLPIIAKQKVWNLALSFSLVVVLAEVATIASALYRRVLAALKMPWG